jgi:hypothetical protein
VSDFDAIDYLKKLGDFLDNEVKIEDKNFVLNPLKTKRRKLCLIPSSYRAVNTFHLGYKIQSVYAVSGTSTDRFI